MSTKTLRKRIALVAVSALGFGLVSAVPAAQAAGGLVITAPGAARVSTAFSLELAGSTIGTIALTQTAVATIRIVPGSLVQPTSGGFVEGAANLDDSFPGTASAASSGEYPFYSSLTIAGITPGAAGSYSMSLWTDLDGDGEVDSTEATGDFSLVVGSTPTQLIASQSSVSANVGSKVTITLTALDAANRKTLIGSGSDTVSADADEELTSNSGVILVNVTGGATALSNIYAAGNTGAATEIQTIVNATAADTAHIVQAEFATSTGWSTGTTYALAESGPYAGSLNSQTLAGSYDSETGNYSVTVYTAAATTDVTVAAAFGTTSGAAFPVFTATAASSTLTISRATVTAPAATTTLGISSSQTLVDSVLTTAAFATTNTTAAGSVIVDVKQPTITFKLSKTGSTDTFGVYVYPNVASITDSGAADYNATIGAAPAKLIPYDDLPGGFQRVTLVDGSATFTVTNLTPSAGEQYSVALVSTAVAPSSSSNNVYAVLNVDYAASATSTTTSSISPSAAVRKYGESSTLTIKVRDQFDMPIAGRVISYTVAGRNPVTTAVQVTTGTDGNAVVTLADKAAETASAKTDTVTVDLYPLVAAGSYVETARITYNAVGSVVKAVNVTDDDAAASTTIVYTTTPYSTYRTVTATVLDANGLGLPGVPVTINLPSDVSLYPTFLASGTTDASGQYAVRVWSTKTGTKSITASAGGLTSTATTLKYVQGGSADTIAQTARKITLSSSSATSKSEGIVQMVATATDLYGNVVAGVEVKLTENGAGRFLVQSGSNSSITAFTDSSGVVTADITSTASETGDNVVTAAFTGNYSNAGTSTDISGDGDYLSLVNYVGTTAYAGAAAGVEKVTQSVSFSGGTAGVTNADVLKAIVSLIASINKQIAALQKALLKK